MTSKHEPVISTRHYDVGSHCGNRQVIVSSTLINAILDQLMTFDLFVFTIQKRENMHHNKNSAELFVELDNVIVFSYLKLCILSSPRTVSPYDI